MPSYTIRTVAFIIKEGKVLLGQRKRSPLGHLLWAGIGGKKEENKVITK